MWRIAEAERVSVHEGSSCAIVLCQMGIESAADARRMIDLKDRLAKFGLLLHETRRG